MALCCLMQACTTVNPEGSVTYSAESDIAQARALMGPEWPQGVDTRLTTAGDIYLANLNSQILALELLMAQRPDDRLLAALALNYYHRFQIVGRLDDAEQALALLQSAAEHEHHSDIDIAHFQVLLGFHKFELAAATLERARQNGARPDSVESLERVLNRSTGAARRIETSLSAFPSSNDSPVQLVTQAAELLERGQAANASVLLKAAQDGYHDTAPYLLAWIQVQQGIVFLRHKDYLSALTFFTAAHERFPQYALATEHLAETRLALGQYRRAANLYREVSAQTGNPEFYYRLAVAERALGLERDAERHEQLARVGYTRLISTHPFMYADHAARYFISSGDPLTALALAQQNFTLRQDIRARTLLLEAILVAGQASAACDELSTIRTLGYAPPELPEFEGELSRLCTL